MDEAEVKPSFRNFVERATTVASALEGISHSNRTPLFDEGYDAHFREILEFRSAAESLAAVAAFEKHFGTAEAVRFALYLLYAYLTAAGPRFEVDTFEEQWSAFWTEIHDPGWRCLSICNLTNFTRSISGISTLDPVDLGDGLEVRARSSTWAECVHKSLWQSLAEDWDAGSHGEFVLVCAATVPKGPDNAISVGSMETQEKLRRALLALRLAACGDVRHGRIFHVRQARVDLGPPGRLMSGWARWNPGAQYVLDEGALLRFRTLYKQLSDARQSMAKGWVPLATALRRFSELYERDFAQGGDRILDAITAIEALLGDKLETTFKVTYRVANLLGSDNDARTDIFSRMKLYYDTRSCLVHGAELKPKHHEVIQDPTAVVEITRCLLVGFLNLAISGNFMKASELKEQIDEILLNSDRTAALRSKMWPDGSTPNILLGD